MSMHRAPRNCVLAPLLLIALAGSPSAVVMARQPEAPAPAPDPAPARDAAMQAALDNKQLSEALKARLSAPYLKPEEAIELRITHGVWAEADLSTPARRARAALARGSWSDASLADESVPVLDRAEAALERGEPAKALELVAADGSIRAVRLRTSALLDLGRTDDALKVGQLAIDVLTDGQVTTSAAITEAVRTLLLLTDVRGTAAGGGDYQAIISLLARARTADPLDADVRLTEAQVLASKDNFAQAQESLQEAMALDPGSARGWALLGQLAVSSFDLKQAEVIAERLDALAGMQPLSVIDAGDDEEEAEAVVGRPDAEPDVEPVDAAKPIEATSALAAEVRAYAMQRQNDPGLGEAALAPALKQFPQRRTLLQHQIATSAINYDWTATQALLDAYDALGPKSPRGYFAAGRALADARQYSQAAKWLQIARDRAPRWSEPVIELGLLEMQSGRDQEALDNLTLAAELDPFNVRVANSLKLIKEVINYTRTEGQHFIVRSRPGLDAMLAAEMLPVLDAMHEVVTGRIPGALDHEPASKTLIDLMPDHAWFAVRIAGLSRIHTIAASTGPIIAMESPRDGKGHTGAYDWERVLRHEYTHTVGLSRTGNRIPHWFTEANAVFLELSPRDYDTCELLTRAFTGDKLFDFTEINIAFTRPKKPTDRPLAYAQGHWMFEYIVERWGREAPLQLMDLYAKGVREEEAYQRVLNISREQFMTDFKAWAKIQLITWGMTPREGEPTLKQLIERDPSTPKRDPLDASVQNLPELTPEMTQRLLKDHPDHADLLEAAVREALDAAGGDATPALRPLLERYAKARPVDPLPIRQLARLALKSATPQDAIPYLEYLDAREQKTPSYAAELARLYAGITDYPKALAKAERSTRLAPYVATQRELAAAIALKVGDRALARKHIRFLIELEPDRQVHKQRLAALDKLAAH